MGCSGTRSPHGALRAAGGAGGRAGNGQREKPKPRDLSAKRCPHPVNTVPKTQQIHRTQSRREGRRGSTAPPSTMCRAPGPTTGGQAMSQTSPCHPRPHQSAVSLVPLALERQGTRPWGSFGPKGAGAAWGWDSGARRGAQHLGSQGLGAAGLGVKGVPKWSRNLPACLGGGWWMCAPWLCRVSPQAPAQLWKGAEKTPKAPSQLQAAPRGSAPHCGSLPGFMGCRDQGTGRLTPLWEVPARSPITRIWA